MQAARLFKLTALITIPSVALAVGSKVSPEVAAWGWAIGTLISVVGGVLHGRSATSYGDAAGGGALVGAAPILLGCLLGYAIGAMPMAAVIAATVVGLVAGALAGPLARAFRRKDAQPLTA